jgi:hypothetical protein
MNPRTPYYVAGGLVALAVISRRRAVTYEPSLKELHAQPTAATLDTQDPAEATPATVSPKTSRLPRATGLRRKAPDVTPTVTDTVDDARKYIDEYVTRMGERPPSTKVSGGLMPVFEPAHNMREVCKQLCLLEDHLHQTDKRCADCIRKHFLTIEGLIEEGIGLDKEGSQRAELAKAKQFMLEAQRQWIAKSVPDAEIAQSLRTLRKRWSEECFTASH